MDDRDHKNGKMTVDDGAYGGRREVSVSYPGNTHRDREEKEEPKKVEKVISGKAVQRKKSLAKKFMETFIGDDIQNISSYIIYDVLIPAAKSTITDIVQSIPEMIFYGEKRSPRMRRDQGVSRISYNNYYQRDRREDRRDISYQNRARHNFDDIILETRGEAEEVISHLVDLILDYGQATVADLYDLVGLTGNFTDNKYGWVDLNSASATRARNGGYQLNLPKAILLD